MSCHSVDTRSVQNESKPGMRGGHQATQNAPPMTMSVSLLSVSVCLCVRPSVRPYVSVGRSVCAACLCVRMCWCQLRDRACAGCGRQHVKNTVFLGHVDDVIFRVSVHQRRRLHFCKAHGLLQLRLQCRPHVVAGVHGPPVHDRPGGGGVNAWKEELRRFAWGVVPFQNDTNNDHSFSQLYVHTGHSTRSRDSEQQRCAAITKVEPSRCDMSLAEHSVARRTPQQLAEHMRTPESKET